jgi:hypothetical protein
MAKFSQKVKGKEVGQASVYAEPHTMSGGKVSNGVKNVSGAEAMKEMNVGVGVVTKGNYKPTKTSGIKTRGNGAATKGLMARGPMA